MQINAFINRFNKTLMWDMANELYDFTIAMMNEMTIFALKGFTMSFQIDGEATFTLERWVNDTLIAKLWTWPFKNMIFYSFLFIFFILDGDLIWVLYGLVAMWG